MRRTDRPHPLENFRWPVWGLILIAVLQLAAIVWMLK